MGRSYVVRMNNEQPTTNSASTRNLHVVAGALVAGLVSCLYYGIDRTIAFLRHGPPNPLGTMNSPRIDYFWRIALAGFLASLAFMAVSWGARKVEPVVIERLTIALMASLVFCSVLAALFP